MSGKRILIMDDDESMRRVLARFLHINGYRVVTVTDAEAAVSAFKSTPCHVAILDVELKSGVDGFSAALRLIALEPRLRVVMMSGNPIHEARAHAAGYPFLSKPFNWQELLEALGKKARDRGEGG